MVLSIAFGPLLIFLLFKLQLTMTIGTLNGIIFYAQAANAGMFGICTCALQTSAAQVYIMQYRSASSFYPLEI